MSATPNVTRCNTDNPTKQDLQKPSWRRSLSDLHHRGRPAFKWVPSPVWPHRPPGFRGRDAAGPSGTAEIHIICRLAGLVLFPWHKGKEMEIQLPAPLPTAAEIGCQASSPCLTVVIFGKKHIIPRTPQVHQLRCGMWNRVLTTKWCFVIVMTTCRRRISQKAAL